MSGIVALTEAASIGLHSMVLIARSDEVVNVAKISEFIGSSRHHVAKIMQRLSKRGFVSSNRGPSGGFILKKLPKDISLLDIYEAIEGPLAVQTCPMDRDVCPFGECLLGDLSLRMSGEIKEFLEGKTLQDYL
ncbi:RrF2 family transcriptional regulator [Marinilabilia rubra]|uniref:Rrf2 family transcriptional regulator n=1 Tax=Marinilabilia rubra TaxID=2162893 RepID=A0A2U2B3L0_9BACT|nr:Rrf2 family transcriptional regulator [Marinilabilia rubra]PWD97634.1 Rrf2 family transcriptional regulator [Marinilabilia rubra]